MTSISVVMSVYNGARFVSETLAAVFKQTRAAHEIIVVNDGSTDDSLDVLSQFRDRIHLIDQENAGVSAARNVGAAAATGDYLAFLDQDDHWPAEKLEVYAEVIEELGADKTQFIFSDFIRENYFTKDKLPSNTDLNPWLFDYLERIPAKRDVYVSSSEDTLEYLLRGYPVYPSTMVVARSRFKVLHWLENFKLAEDFSFSLLNALQGGSTYIHRPLGIITRHDANGSLDQLKMKDSDVIALEWFLQQDLFSAKHKHAIGRSLGYRLAGLGWHRRRTNRAEALKYYLRAFKYPNAKLMSAKGMIRTLLPV